MSNLHNIGLSGLMAARSGLDSTAQNVSNTLTEFYCRRDNIFEPNQTHGNAANVMVAGVSVAEVRRITDDFVTTRVWYTSGEYQYSQAVNSYMQQLDEILGGDNTGYAEPLNQLQRSLQRAGVTPESVAVRQQVLGDARLAGMQLNTLQERLMAFHEQMNVQTYSLVSEVNQLAGDVASINDRIRAVTVAGSDSSDLLDNRSRIIDRLAELAGVSVQDAGDNMVNVLLAGGEALVSGNESATLTVAAGVPDVLKPEIRIGNGQTRLATEKWSGMLGGITQFREQILLREQNTLGYQAVLLASGCNTILSQGFDLNDNVGQELFRSVNDSSVLNRRILTEQNAGAAGLTLTIDESQIGSIQDSDYQVSFSSSDGSVEADECKVIRKSDGETAYAGTLDSSTPIPFDGLELAVSGTPHAGDAFLLVPWRYEAGNIQVALDDPKALGFAGSDNDGDEASAVSLGPGDNSNLYTLLAYINGEGLDTSLPVIYTREVSRVATDARQAISREQAEKALRTSARAERDNLSGVNLDEEAANLIRFQQYYQANIRVIAAGTLIIDELLALA